MLPQIEGNKTLISPLMLSSNSMTFPKFIESISDYTENLARDLIKQYLETADQQFRDSQGRKDNYYVKAKRERTLITMFGEVRYKRTIYQDKYTGKTYIYVDRKFGIDRYIHYTNDVASYAYEAYGDENSMIKVGKEIGNLIYGKYKIVKNSEYSLSRQLIKNLIFRVEKPVRTKYTGEKKQLSDLYVIIDEKYIPQQMREQKALDKGKKVMSKVAVIVEGINTEDKNRHKYVNPYYFTQYKGNFADDLAEIIYDRYDIEKLQHIHYLSDGGTWIKGLKSDMKMINVDLVEYTDKFHAFKALWSLTLDNDKYKEAIAPLVSNKKDEFKQYLDTLEIPESKQDRKSYLLNNWETIQNMLSLKTMNCAAEQVISHHVASEFTSVAKAYGKSNLNLYLAMRDSYRNNENLRELFLMALDREDADDKINKDEYDFSMFNKDGTTHDYTTMLNNGDHLKMGHF